jgi:Tfp pilus assembly pilus retraction ATPase PilT
MAKLQWDRLLETCFKQGATDILLAPDCPPLLRIAIQWRAIHLDEPLTRADLVALAKERLGPKPGGETDDYTFSDFAYGNVARFRAMAFGYPETALLLIARHSA